MKNDEIKNHMISEALGIDIAELLAHPELAAKDDPRIREFRRRLAAREPLAYISGYQPFCGLNILVDRRALIPRPETELLVEETLGYLKKCRMFNYPLSILDLCTGSGAIAVTLAKFVNHARITAVDISSRALEVAQKNALYHGVEKRTAFIRSDLFSVLEDMKFDIIVTNPPYIPSKVIATLEPEVKDHEPRIALDGGHDGLDLIRRILSDAPAHLKTGGRLFMEIGAEESVPAKNHLIKNGYRDIEIKKDYAGIDRIVSASFHDIQCSD